MVASCEPQYARNETAATKLPVGDAQGAIRGDRVAVFREATTAGWSLFQQGTRTGSARWINHSHQRPPAATRTHRPPHERGLRYDGGVARDGRAGGGGVPRDGKDCAPVTRLQINGKSYDVATHPDAALLWALRDEIGCSSVKYGCGSEQ